MFIDTHAHLNFKAFKNDYKEAIKRAFDNNIKGIINIGSNFSTSLEATRIAHEYGEDTNGHEYESRTDRHECGVWAAVGLHPIHLVKDIVESATFNGKEYAFKTNQEVFNYEKYKKLALSSKKVIAIGETGLDYFRLIEDDKSQDTSRLHSRQARNKIQDTNKSQVSNYKQIQKKVFKEHIRLATELKLPLIIHCREEENDPYGTYNELLEILRGVYPEILHCVQNDSRRAQNGRRKGQNDKLKGVIHCFGGSLEQAQEFIKLGFYLGFTGIVTFKNAKEVQDVAEKIPLDKILIETDAPFLAPIPHRGKRNEPAYVIEVARKIAEIKNVSFEKVEEQTT